MRDVIPVVFGRKNAAAPERVDGHPDMENDINHWIRTYIPVYIKREGEVSCPRGPSRDAKSKKKLTLRRNTRSGCSLGDFDRICELFGVPESRKNHPASR